jgi:hypothetical protein
MPMISIPVRRLAPFLLLALAGCADSPSPLASLPRTAVSGTVTLDGQTLAQGKIEFEPIAATQGVTVVVGEIKDGKYSIDRAAGPVPGKYKVLISSRPQVTINPNDQPGPLPKVEPEKVPAQYNKMSTLTKDIADEKVAAIDFDLKSS